MKDALSKLKEFHEAFNCTRQDKPGGLSRVDAKLRLNLIHEELRETERAMEDLESARHPSDRERALCDIADGLADLCYVVIGTAVAYGIPLDRVFDEVHRSNMTKVGPDGKVQYRSDGKVLKPSGWTPPDIKGVLGL